MMDAGYDAYDSKESRLLPVGKKFVSRHYPSHFVYTDIHDYSSTSEFPQALSLKSITSTEALVCWSRCSVTIYITCVCVVFVGGGLVGLTRAMLLGCTRARCVTRHYVHIMITTGFALQRNSYNLTIGLRYVSRYLTNQYLVSLYVSTILAKIFLRERERERIYDKDVMHRTRKLQRQVRKYRRFASAALSFTKIVRRHETQITRKRNSD